MTKFSVLILIPTVAKFGIMFVMAALLALTPKANAGFLIEPGVSYELGKLTCKTAALVVCDGDISGIAGSLNLGYIFSKGFWIAAEAESIGSKMKFTGTTPESNAIRANYGVLLGFDRNRFRIWAGYLLQDKFNGKVSGLNGDFSGTGIKVGLGFLVWRKLSLNFEYAIDTYTKFKANGSSTEQTVSTLFNTFNQNRYSVGLSIPFYSMK
jgi:hypothetical protein